MYALVFIGPADGALFASISTTLCPFIPLFLFLATPLVQLLHQHVYFTSIEESQMQSQDPNDCRK